MDLSVGTYTDLTVVHGIHLNDTRIQVTHRCRSHMQDALLYCVTVRENITHRSIRVIHRHADHVSVKGHYRAMYGSSHWIFATKQLIKA